MPKVFGINNCMTQYILANSESLNDVKYYFYCI